MIYGIRETAELAALKEDTLRHLILRGKILKPQEKITGGFFYGRVGLKTVLQQIEKIKIKNRNFYKFYLKE